MYFFGKDFHKTVFCTLYSFNSTYISRQNGKIFLDPTRTYLTPLSLSVNYQTSPGAEHCQFSAQPLFGTILNTPYPGEELYVTT